MTRLLISKSNLIFGEKMKISVLASLVYIKLKEKMMKYSTFLFLKSTQNV